MENFLDKREKLAREIAKIAGSAAITLSLIATVSFLSADSNSSISDIFTNDESVESETFESNKWDDSWVPVGYTAWASDSNIAWRWASKDDCNNYRCITAEFISQYGCPSGLYVALNWLDKNDSVVGYTNETLPSLLSRQNAKLTFEDYEDVSNQGQISSIKCS